MITIHDIFYFTDVHGMYELYKAAINYCLKEDPECSIIYGGDACDRGPNGYKIMKKLLTHPQILYLKGNHEDMFTHAAWAIFHEYKSPLNEDNVSNYLYSSFISENPNQSIYLCLYNGGYSTLHDWMLDGMSMDFVADIASLPLTFSYEKLDFCHASGRYQEFKNAALSEYNDEWVDKDDMMMLLWDRNYLGQGWAPGRTCIFGHTPTVHLPAKYYGKDKSISSIKPCAYVGQLDDEWTGRKIDMDTGTFNSKKLYVLNCLTMKAQGFYNNQREIEKIEVIKF